MKDFYEAVSACNSNMERVAITVAEGPGAGEKALLEGGRLVWVSERAGYLAGRAEAMASFDKAGLVEMDGRRIYREVLGGETKLVVCGAGHVSLQVVALGKQLGFTVTVLEDRESFAEAAREAGADRVICAPFEEGLARISGGRDTFFVVVTREHLWDQVCLRALADKPCAYVGMMGSHRRVEMVKKGLLAEGYNADYLASIHTPIGLAIGAETPAEIAVSIMAEIIKVKNENTRALGLPREIQKAITGGRELPAVLATIVSRRGSGPRDVGTKMLVTPDCSIATIGGGIAEWNAILAAREMLSQGDTRPRILTQSFMAASETEAAMVCGGEVEILLEVVWG